MFKKIVIDIIIGLLVKLGGYFMKAIKDAKKVSDIKRDQKKKEKAVEDAKTAEDIRTAHRNNKL